MPSYNYNQISSLEILKLNMIYTFFYLAFIKRPADSFPRPNNNVNIMFRI